MRLLFIHGRAQEGRSSDEIRDEWIETLKIGLDKSGLQLPSDIGVDAPFYGDTLDSFLNAQNQGGDPSLAERGATGDDAFEEFLYEAANEMRTVRGISDDDVVQFGVEAGLIEAADSDLAERGFTNWGFVRSVVQFVDGMVPGVSGWTIKQILRDVHIYMHFPSVWREIHQIVRSAMTNEPTVIIAHSLGSVAAYRMLVEEQGMADLVQLITVGSPLGIRAINRRFGRLEVPDAKENWLNALDPDDIVALHALDARNFYTNPAIENIADIDNRSENQHSITGYLDDRRVASAVHQALTQQN